MDTELIYKLIDDFPSFTTKQLLSEYNERSILPPLTYPKFVTYITQYPDIYDKLMESKEQREAKLKLVVQDIEDALLNNAVNGDYKSAELVLKTQTAAYKDRRQLDVSISMEYQEQLNKLDVAITSNNLPMLEADIVDEDI